MHSTYTETVQRGKATLCACRTHNTALYVQSRPHSLHVFLYADCMEPSPTPRRFRNPFRFGFLVESLVCSLSLSLPPISLIHTHTRAYFWLHQLNESLRVYFWFGGACAFFVCSIHSLFRCCVSGFFAVAFEYAWYLCSIPFLCAELAFMFLCKSDQVSACLLVSSLHYMPKSFPLCLSLLPNFSTQPLSMSCFIIFKCQARSFFTNKLDWKSFTWIIL